MSSRSISRENLVARRFAAIAQASNILVVALDKRGRIKFFNRGCEEATGYSSEELIRKSFVARLIPRAQQKAIRQQLRDVMATSGSTQTVTEVETKTGILRTIEWTHTPITDDEGTLREIISVGQDITEEEYAEEAYRAIVEHSPQGLIILQEGRIVFANSVTAEQSGYSIDEILAKSPTDVMGMLHPEDQKVFLKRLQERFAGKPSPAIVEYRFLHRDGTERWVQGFPAIISYRGKPAVQVAFVDITENKQAEQALRESQEFASTILDRAPNPILVVNPDTSIRYANAALEELIGLSASELIGLKPPFPWWREDWAVDAQQVFSAVMKIGFRLREAPIRIKGGEMGWMEITSTPVMVDGELKYYISNWVDRTKRKEAEAALLESEAMYRSVVESALLAITIRQGDGFVFANAAAAAIHGCSVEELIAFTPEDMVASLHPDERETAFQRHKDRMAGKPIPVRYESRLVRKDGTVLWVEGYSQQVKYKGAPATQFHTIDITERKQAEEALRESEAKYRAVVEGAPFSIVIRQGNRMVYVNEDTAGLYGYSVEEFLSLSNEQFIALLHPEDRTLAIQRGKDRIAGKAIPDHYQYRIIRRDGSMRWLEIWETQVTYQGAPAIQVIAIDITERKEIEAALQESEARYHGLFSRIPVSLYRSTPEGQIVDANPAMAQLLGYPDRESLLRANADDFYADQAVRQQWQRLMVEKGMVRDFLVQMRRLDGELVWVQDTAQVIRDTEGKTLTYEGLLKDITEQKLAGEALRESEAKYRDLVEQSLLGIIILQENPLRISFVNEAAAKLSGYAVDEALGLSPQEIQESFHSEDRVETFRRLAARFRGEEVPPRWELRLVHKDGSTIWVDMTAQTIEFKGEPAVQATLVDISERKQSEDLIRIQRDLGLSLAATSDLQTVLKLCLEATIEASKMDCGGVYLVNEVTGGLELVIHQGLSPSFLRHASYYEADSPNAQVVMKGTPVYLNYEEFPIPSEAIDFSEGLKALAVIPISHENRVIGCLNVSSHSKDVVPVHARTALEIVAAQIGTAIARTRVEQALRESESALRDSEERFRQFFENAPEYCYMISPEGVILSVNRAALKALEYTKDELVGQHLRVVYAPETLPKMESVFKRWSEKGELRDEEIVIISKKGIKRTVLLSASAVRSHEGQILYSVSIQVDITERMAMEAALKRERDLAQQYLDIAGVIMVVLDTQERVVLINRKGCELLGVSEEEILGKNWFDNFLPERLHQDVKQVYAQLMAGEITPVEYYENPILTIQGEERLIAWHNVIFRDEEGNILGSLSSGEDITERREVEAALRESQQRYRSLFEEAPISLWEEDFSDVKHFLDSLRASGVTDFRAYFDDHPEAVATCAGLVKVIDVNKATLELYHAVNKEDFIHNLEQVFCEETYPMFMEQLIAIAEGKTTFSSEAITQNLTGEKNHVFLQWTVAPGYEETWGKLLVSIVDISERKEMERALQESEAKLRSVTEHSPDQILLLDQDLGILFINRTTPDTAREEILGRSILDFTSPDFQKVASDCYQRVWETGKPDTFYTEYRPEEGEVLHFEIRVAPILESERVVALVSISTDITARREAERAVRESETKYRSFVENFLGIAYRSRPDYSIEFFHGAVQSITGYAEEDFVSGRVHWNQVIHPDDWIRLQKDFDRMGRVPGAIGELEYRIIRKDGNIRWLHDNMRGLYDKDYSVTAIEGVLIDITERKEAEDAAFEAWARAEFFNDLMVHDLTNIHQAIMSLLELVLLDSALPSQAREFVQTALAQLIRSSDLISKVKKFALIDTAPLTREQRDLSEPLFAAADAIRDSYPQRKLHIRTLISPGKYYAQVDEFLYDMFFNLLHNAMRYDRRDEVRVDILVELEREFLKIQIQDRGPGIADGDKEQIFARLSSRERGERGVRGRGIGLTLVQRIVTRYRGKIWVEDRVPGDHSQGASFVVLLPRGDAE